VFTSALFARAKRKAHDHEYATLRHTNYSVGDDCIIAAGALLAKNKLFPPRSLIVGTPAKVVRELNDDEVAFIKASAAKYVTVAHNHAEVHGWQQ
jgi:carbonic anhydrase/acetyltransferase-like protein (isoleucine patch superfamily)